MSEDEPSTTILAPGSDEAGRQEQAKAWEEGFKARSALGDRESPPRNPYG